MDADSAEQLRAMHDYRQASDYYAVLNVPRSASTDEVHDAYKRLSRIFHPDRHQTPEQQQWAKQQFLVIQQAQDVLTDPKMRAAYDTLGQDGLPMARALGRKVQTQSEFRAHFEREARAQREMSIETWAQSKSSISGTLRCFGQGAPVLQVLHMNHSFSMELADNVSATFMGNMFKHGKNGSGTVIGTLQWTMGPLGRCTLCLPAIKPYFAIFEAQRQLSHRVTLGTRIAQYSKGAPSVTATIIRNYGANTAGSLSVRTGSGYMGLDTNAVNPHVEASHVELALQRALDQKNVLKVGVIASTQKMDVFGSYELLIDKQFSLKTSASAATWNGMLYEVCLSAGLRSTISSWTTLVWKVDVGLATGIKATIKIQRLEHKLSLPLLLTPYLDLDVLLGATLVPLGLALGVHLCWTAPRRRRLEREAVENMRNELMAQLYKQKCHAEEAARLMAPHVERAQSQARASGGLVIEKALYGDLPFGIAAQNCNMVYALRDTAEQTSGALLAADEPRACDVTVPVAALVNGDQLVIAAGGSKRFLPGFYDPAFGHPKSLFVRYRFRNAVHEVVVRDGEALALPMRAHLTGDYSKSHYDETLVYKYASQKINPVSIGQLLKYRRLPLSRENILDSVAYSQAELPVRLAKRVISFHNLPFIIGTNPHISRVYTQYYEAFDRLHAFAPIKDLESEWEFTRALEKQTQILADVIPAIAQGFLECKQYMMREQRTAFINDLIRSRIGLRVIGEQHVALSYQFRNEQTLDKDEPWVGAIHTKLLPVKMLEQCAQMVQNMCEIHYGTAPSYVFDGDVDETISYIPSHFEYITCELLKNAFRATVDFTAAIDRSAHPPIRITISKGDGYVGVRIRDQGGGISKENQRNIFEYSWSSMQTTDDFSSGTPSSSSSSHNSTMAAMSMQTNIALQQGVGGPIAGLGFGLPMARLYARYFGGSLDIVSMEGFGCDVFLKLRSIEGSVEDKQI
ncbi:hypothetical protein GGI07_000773 [Coemansia sp. Benny D115]|nr:hypothetical protein GGI07_000773 [Coemansia sp. Benny D115]